MHLTNKKIVAAIMFGVALVVWYFPRWNGLLETPIDYTSGDARIIASIFMVGSLMLWYLPEKTK